MSFLIALNDRVWPAVTLLLAVLVTVLSLIPLPEPLAGSRYFNDKLNHMIAYAAIAFPVALARPRGWLAFVALIAGWSAVIEAIQPYFGRHASALDLVANLTGIAAGTAAAVMFRLLLRLPPRGEARQGSPAGRR